MKFHTSKAENSCKSGWLHSCRLEASGWLGMFCIGLRPPSALEPFLVTWRQLKGFWWLRNTIAWAHNLGCHDTDERSEDRPTCARLVA